VPQCALAAELVRIHCLDKESIGWTAPTTPERLGKYRAEFEQFRARSAPSLRCSVTRGLPNVYGTPDFREAAARIETAALANSLKFERLVFEPEASATEIFDISHFWIVADAERLKAAAKAHTVEKAKRLLEGSSFVRIYGDAIRDTKEGADAVIDAFCWLRKNAEYSDPIFA
jgi:hypothetical protein